MTTKSRNRRVFADILADLEESNSRRVAARAVLANRTAKIAANGTGRARAYARKAEALLHGIETFPREYRLARVEDDGVSLAIDFRDRPALHLPRSAFDGGRARAWLIRQQWRLASASRLTTPALEQAA